MRARVIFNPTAKGDKARHFREHLNDIARDATLALTTRAGDARALSATAVEEGCDTIVAAGGDGTLNEVLNGIGDVPGGFEKVRLGVMPLGTVNVFARELRLPTDLTAAWETILHGRVIQIDLPVAQHELAGRLENRYFAQLAGAGFDAKAIELTDWSLKKRIGPLAYVVAGLKCMFAARSSIKVEIGNQCCTGELVLIGNGRLYGGNYPIFSEADLRDGLLEVAVFPKVNWLTLAWCGPSLLTRGKLPNHVAQRFKGARVRLTSSSGGAFQVDGELVGKLPAEISVGKSILRVLAP